MLVLNGSLGADSRSATMEFPDVEFLEPDRYLIKVAVMAPGRAMARTGLRMMPTFSSLPLKSRTAGFPQYGFKAGTSDRALTAARYNYNGNWASSADGTFTR